MPESLLLIPDYSNKSRRDIIGICDYFDKVSEEVSERFLRAVDTCVDLLLRSPELGEKLNSEKPVRYRTIKGFRNYVVFY
ncbi:MAG: type II toxin-antitoxin system RelE/ParE family toxin [Thermoguttaceae bacterium]